ncbi:IS256 family transposase, partial [Pseudonocardia spinosispora]|uniref:IS256 family transposase n=1 Tax=Pseudonocardia spinosispora TaxID=103441 RepID=UPI00048EB1CB
PARLLHLVADRSMGEDQTALEVEGRPPLAAYPDGVAANRGGRDRAAQHRGDTGHPVPPTQHSQPLVLARTTPNDRNRGEPVALKGARRVRRAVWGNGPVATPEPRPIPTRLSAHLSEVYGAEVSRQTISTITDKVVEGMLQWQNRPLDAVYPVIFIDAIHVKIRDGKVANRPIYVALAVTCEGHRDILGLWAGDGGEGAKHWLHVLTELKNRGVNDVLMVVCDGLTGLPDAIAAVWPQTITQTCIVHLLRNSFRYAGRQHYDAIAKALKPVYTAATEATATERFLEFAETWGERYPAIVRLWENAWSEFVPFLNFDTEIRRVVCSTNAIESVNARIRRAVKARGHFPSEAAALKCVYMAVMSLDPTGQGRKRWTMRWKPALNAFEIAFDGRLAAGRK